MLHLKTLLVIALIPVMFSTAQAQETKKVKKTIAEKGFTVKKSYEVLKSDPEVLHGTYTYNLSSYEEQGQYNQGKKSGVWSCYSSGKLVQQYDFNTGKFVLPGESKLIDKIIVLDETGTEVKEIPSQPIYIGGDEKMLTIFRRAVRYPGEAQSYNVQGKVEISAIIGKDGIIRDEKAESNLGRGLEEETLRVFKLMPQDWIPVTQDGKPVDVKILLHFTFTLS